MKRYRWMSFFVDTQRNLVKTPVGAADTMVVSGAVGMVAMDHGTQGIHEKYMRWLQLCPPNLCVPVEWHDLLREIDSAYVHGDFYPALTGACCLGERALNHLLLGLRDSFKTSSRYKEVYRKESIQDWDKLISILREWKVLTAKLQREAQTLQKMRNPSVHYGSVRNRGKDALRAVQAGYSLIDDLFGLSSGHFFIVQGEIYVKQARQRRPLVAKMILPHCHLVGFKHRIKQLPEGLKIKDNEKYERGSLNDKQFADCRRSWRKQLSGTPNDA